MDTKTAQRQLKIKTGALKRQIKDYQSYAKENILLQERLEKMKADEAEEGLIRRAEEAVAETMQMLPITHSKINAAVEDVRNLLDENEANEELKQTEDWQLSNTTLNDALAFLETI